MVVSLSSESNIPSGLFTQQHGITFQKAWNFSNTDVRTSDLTNYLQRRQVTYSSAIAVSNLIILGTDALEIIL